MKKVAGHNRRSRRRRSAYRLESLESRRLLALVGIGAGTFPDVTFGPVNALDPTPPVAYPLTYTANGSITVADNFDTDATPLFVRFPGAPGVQRPVGNALAGTVVRDFRIDIFVDENGDLIGGNPGNDLHVRGQVTDTSPGGPTTYGNVTGTLLTGEIVAFGWANTTNTTSVATADNYDFVFRPTGGEMVGLFGDNYIGVLLQSSDSTFAGDFNGDFRGRASGDLFPVDWAEPGIDLVKKTNGTDNNSPTGPVVPAGSTVTWTYDVTNTSNVVLENVVVTDDNGTPGNTGDDFVVGTVPSLAPGASVSFTATGTATAGQYENTATATGNYTLNFSVSDTDVDHHFGATPAIDLVKKTNGTDNNSPTGPLVPIGSTVTWTYEVINTGNVPLSNATVVDDNGTPNNTGDDFTVGTIPSLAVGASTTLSATGTAAAGQYENFADVTGTDPTGATVTDSDLDHYFGVNSSIALVKRTNGTDNNSPTGPVVAVGSTVTFTYIVTNTGNVPLVDVQVVDDNGTQTNLSDDFVAGMLATLAPGASVTFTATRTAGAGQYMNVATATAFDDFGNDVGDSDVDHHFGVNSGINIVKKTNGTDNNTPTGPTVTVGQTVTWTYFVTNTGNVSLSNVAVRDDNGTPGNTSDDFTPTRTGGDTNNNNLLDVNETWLYAATGTAQAGQYANYGTVTGKDTLNRTVTDNDIDHYIGVAQKNASVSGKKWRDVTGNGLTSDDQPLANTVIYIDANNNGVKDTGEKSTTTGSTGAYSFTGLAAGNYIIREVVPSGYVRTHPTTQNYYSVTLAAGQAVTGKDFANFQMNCDCTVLGDVYYVINGTTVVDYLSGNVKQGDQVTVKFKINSGPSQLFSLVSYKAPSGVWDPNVASQQTVFDQASGTFGPGGYYSLTITVPNSYFQVDFVCGPVINKLGPNGSNIFYGSQDRLKDAVNGGTNAPFSNGSSISGRVFQDKYKNSRYDAGTDPGIAGVLIKLTGTDSTGKSITWYRTTAADGTYSFKDLRASNSSGYTVTEVSQPSGYYDYKDYAGTIDGVVKGNASLNDKVSAIVLGLGKNGVNYNFSEWK